MDVPKVKEIGQIGKLVKKNGMGAPRNGKLVKKIEMGAPRNGKLVKENEMGAPRIGKLVKENEVDVLEVENVGEVGPLVESIEMRGLQASKADEEG